MFAGSYDSLFYDIPGHLNRIRIALLIEFHMHPYLAWEQSEKAKQRDTEMFGKEFIAEVMMLHRADIAAH